MRTALVTGATGFLGAEVARQLASDGVRVRALLRPASDSDRLPGEVTERVTCRDDDAACLRETMAGVDVVFHLGARVDAGAMFRTDDDDGPYERDNVARTEALLDAALGSSVGRFLLMSSGSVYAPGTPSPIAETAPTAPRSAYARSKLAAEELAWRSQRRGLGVTVVRGSLMFGPGDRHFRPLVDRVMRLPLVPLPGGGRALHDLVHVSDVASLLILAASTPVAEGRTYNVGSGHPLSVREIARRLRAELGHGPRIIGLPPRLMQAGFVPVRAILVRAVPELADVLTPSLLDYFSHDFYFSPKRAATELGWQATRALGPPP
ncbi:MAG: NAD-dependent epimerase/dehydratase family protein [Chloroflexota bacterium]|jgi:nucleoside-diphosphate-sugar epimerase